MSDFESLELFTIDRDYALHFMSDWHVCNFACFDEGCNGVSRIAMPMWAHSSDGPTVSGVPTRIVTSEDAEYIRWLLVNKHRTIETLEKEPEQSLRLEFKLEQLDKLLEYNWIKMEKAKETVAKIIGSREELNAKRYRIQQNLNKLTKE